jgi:hypothetical protein
MNFWIILLLAALLFTVLLYPFRTHWFYLCRTSLLGLLFLGLLPVLARYSERSLLIGVFDLDTGTDLDTGINGMVVGFLLFFAAWAIIATSQLVIRLADARLGVTVPAVGGIFLWLRFALILLAVGINGWAVWYATDGPQLQVFLGLLAGLAAGLVFFAVIQFGELKKRQKPNKTVWSWLWQQLFDPEVRVPDKPDVPGARFQLFGIIPVSARLGRGYLHKTKKGATKLLPDHFRTVFALISFAVLYVCLPFLSGKFPLSALCYLLLLLIIFIWFLSSLTFFFDSYRVPLLIVLIPLVCLASWNKHSDHFYRIWPAGPHVEPDTTDTNPGEVLARAADDGQPVVLIAAAGGGIQAAAWTAQVLTGLEEILDEKTKKPGIFARSIRLLSGVSGGSVGIMFYVHGTYPLGTTNLSAVDRHKKIMEAAMGSSLGQAVQGLAYPDLWRCLNPGFGLFDDRATRLEGAWIENDDRQFGWSDGASLKDATLTKWQHDLAERNRPAVIFNSTVVETGERFTFSTSQFRKDDLAQSQSDFATYYKDTDISIPTAVRLSATFPVVSPAAQPELVKDSTSNNPIRDGRDIPRLHLVDGGYFDNSGLIALSTWLDSALQYVVLCKNPSKVPGKILVIQILPFPEPPSPGNEAPATPFSQILSPLQTVLSVREQVQTGMTQRDFAFVSTRWKLEAFNPVSPAKIRPIDIQLVNVVYQNDGQRYTPLSWHLRKSEQQAIEDTWKRFKNPDRTTHRGATDWATIESIESFFSGN